MWFTLTPASFPPILPLRAHLWGTGETGRHESERNPQESSPRAKGWTTQPNPWHSEAGFARLNLQVLLMGHLRVLLPKLLCHVMSMIQSSPWIQCSSVFFPTHDHPQRHQDIRDGSSLSQGSSQVCRASAVQLLCPSMTESQIIYKWSG